MSWENLIGPVVFASLLSSIASMFATWWVQRNAFRLSQERNAFEERMALQRLQFDKELADRRFENDLNLAKEKLEIDIELIRARRRFELAEKLLADAYKFQGLMKYARNGFSSGNEGSSRPQNPDEPPDQLSIKNTYYVPVERLEAEREFISSFLSKRYEASSIISPQISEAMRTLTLSYRKVYSASQTLIESVGDDIDRDFHKNLISNIWGTMDENDKIGNDVDEAVKQIEDICAKTLRGQFVTFSKSPTQLP